MPRLQARSPTRPGRGGRSLGRLALLHRTGVLEVGDSAAVVVVVSAPHRAEAFDAARFCIDTLKRSVPIWKRETWSDGESWGLEAQHIVDARQQDDADERPSPFLMIAVVISVVGSLVLYLRNRTPSSLESGIDNFRREMQALAPRDDEVPPRRWWKR